LGKDDLQLIRLCSLGDLGASGAKGVVIGSGLEQSRYVIVRAGDGVKCYLNECPHQGTPLDTFPNKFLDELGEHLVCSTHGARFKVEDGVCVLGPCLGQSLSPRDILIRDGQVYLANDSGEIL